MNTVNCTPTWKAAATIYLTVIEQEAEADRYFSPAMKNAREGIYEMAAHLDRINSEQQKVTEANKAELSTGKIVSTEGSFTLNATGSFGKYSIRMMNDDFAVADYDAVRNEFWFFGNIGFTSAALKELVSTGNCMHQFYSK